MAIESRTPLLTAAMIVLPALYVASFGPACWLVSRTGADEGFFFQTAYWPLGQICLREPVPRSVLSAYARIGLPEGATVAIPAQYGFSRIAVIETDDDGGP